MLPATLLPLTRFSELVGYSPVLFNQVFIPGLQDAVACSDPVLEYIWQQRGGGQPGRHEIAQAVQRAEEALEYHLGFSVAPEWRVETVRPPYTGSNWRGAGLYQVPLQLKSGYVQQLGVEVRERVDTLPVTYTDNDGDGYSETGTVVVTTDIPAGELHLYYPGVDPSYGEQREIRPIVATQNTSLGTVTIRFQRYLGVRFELLETFNAAGVDGTAVDAFIDNVDVYRQYADTGTQIVVSWQPPFCTDDLLTAQTQTAFGTVLDGRLGAVVAQPADYSALTSKWTRTFPLWWQRPTHAQVYYQAGYPLVNGRMAPVLERAVVFLALNYLDCPWTTCEPLRALMEHWRTDLAERRSDPAGSVGYVMSPGMLENPLGTTRAAVHAWRVVQQLVTGRAVAH